MKRLALLLGLLLVLMMAYGALGQGHARTWILQNAATAASTGTGVL